MVGWPVGRSPCVFGSISMSGDETRKRSCCCCGAAAGTVCGAGWPAVAAAAASRAGRPQYQHHARRRRRADIMFADGQIAGGSPSAASIATVVRLLSPSRQTDRQTIDFNLPRSLQPLIHSFPGIIHARETQPISAITCAQRDNLLAACQ